MQAYSISGINNLPEQEKRDIFLKLIPEKLYQRFNLPRNMIDAEGNNLLVIKGNPGGQGLELYLYHQAGFQDPILYAHLVDTLNAQIHVLLYIMNDPDSPRFNVDRMPDGTKTEFGTKTRNIEEELRAMEAGLLPGQIRKGLSILSDAVVAFEDFVIRLGHRMYFNEPLYYHNAIIFERYGFNYQKGRRKMEAIHQRFTEDETLAGQLGTSPFRRPEAKTSIFFRSWAIHDGILGEPFNDVTMYRTIGSKSNIRTAPNIRW